MKGEPMLGSEAGWDDLQDGAIGGGEGSVCTPRFAAGVANSVLPAADGPCSPVVLDCDRTGAVPGRISLLYESRDGGICVFEDAEGHLTAVRTSRLA